MIIVTNLDLFAKSSETRAGDLSALDRAQHAT
jgi:hypothetical protein